MNKKIIMANVPVAAALAGSGFALLMTARQEKEVIKICEKYNADILEGKSQVEKAINAQAENLTKYGIDALTAESVRLAAQNIADQTAGELKGEARRQIDLSTRKVVEKYCKLNKEEIDKLVMDEVDNYIQAMKSDLDKQILENCQRQFATRTEDYFNMLTQVQMQKQNAQSALYSAGGAIVKDVGAELSKTMPRMIRKTMLGY